MKKIILLGVISISLFSCKKEAITEECYECKDQPGQYLGTVCGASESDAFNKSGSVNGSHTIENFRSYCKLKK